MKFGPHILGLLALPAVGFVLLLFAETRPQYFTNLNYLGGLLLLEIIILLVWNYERFFFLAMMLAFVWGGTGLPFAGAGSAARWVFLIVGALVGIVKWVENNSGRHFGAIHLIAAFCVLSAAVSAVASNRTESALLKSV